MTNDADTQYAIHELLTRRWSPRSFSDRRVGQDHVRALFEAARWAPSSYNEQPWNFLIAMKDDRESFFRLVDCLTEGNRKWAQRAPVLILSIAKLYFDKNDKFNRHAFHDVGLAVENLIIQATDMNLYVHQMAGFDREAARRVFGIPDGHEPVAVMAVGYPDDEISGESLKERTRKPFNEFVFEESFGKPSKLFA